jgi:hypothetical protein
MLSYEWVNRNASEGTEVYCFYRSDNFNVSSFNLLGCDSVTKIKNLTDSSLY